MLANEAMMAAAKAARVEAVAAVLRADPRVVFGYMAERRTAACGDGPGKPCVAVYLDGEDDAEARGADLAVRLGEAPGVGRLDVAVLNTMDLDEAGRMLDGADPLVDRNPRRRAEFAFLADGAYIDFRESEALFLRERAERPYADTLSVKLGELDEAVERLRGLSGLTVDEYLADWKAAFVVERALEVAINLSIDLARHVLAERALARPVTYRETFAMARDAGLIERAVAEPCMRLCGLRNRLAHEGTRLDARLVVRAVGSGAQDLARFRDAVSRL